MDGASELMVLLMDIAEEMIGGGEPIPSATFDAVREMLPVPCDQEEIAGLALVALLTEHGLMVVPAGDLIARLSRRSPVRPRWDLVLPHLARKQLVVLLDREGETISADSGFESWMRGNELRDLRVALLVDGGSEIKPDGYGSNREYLEDCFAYLQRLCDELGQMHPPASPGRAPFGTGGNTDSSGIRLSVETEAAKRRIERKAAAAECVIPVEDLRRAHGLDDRDWHVLLHLLGRMLAGENTEVRHFTLFFGGSAFARYDMKKYFREESPLFASGIVELSDFRDFMRSDVILNEEYAGWLIEGDQPPQNGPAAPAADAAVPFAGNDDYLEQWLRFVGGLLEQSEGHNVLRRKKVDRRRIPLAATGMEEFRTLKERSEAGGTDFPFERLLREHGLDDNERLILLAGLDGGFRGNHIDIPDMLPLLAGNLAEMVQLRRYFQPDARIVAQDLIDVRVPTFGTPDFIMPEKTMMRLFDHGSTAGDSEAHMGVSDLFSVREPRHTLAELQLPAAELARIERAVRGLDAGVQERLQSWGAGSIGSRREAGSLLLLFSGEPGTGKTFGAEALAGSLGRSLLVTDISRLLSKWVGESEQQVSELFREYRALCARDEAPPVLLLNECDQFLGRRYADADRSVDRMYNQMLSLFLENLETFPGVLVATTNLADALDDAFSRRFDEKIVFPLPDSAVRLKLWQAHLPAGVPGADAIDLAALAEAYAFSGGQIAVAAANAVRRAALRGDVLRMEDLLEACGNEAKGAFGGQGEVMGFRR